MAKKCATTRMPTHQARATQRSGSSRGPDLAERLSRPRVARGSGRSRWSLRAVEATVVPIQARTGRRSGSMWFSTSAVTPRRPSARCGDQFSRCRERPRMTPRPRLRAREPLLVLSSTRPKPAMTEPEKVRSSTSGPGKALQLKGIHVVGPRRARTDDRRIKRADPYPFDWRIPLSIKAFLNRYRPPRSGIGRVYPANIRPSHLHPEPHAGARVSTRGDRAEGVQHRLAPCGDQTSRQSSARRRSPGRPGIWTESGARSLSPATSAAVPSG